MNQIYSTLHDFRVRVQNGLNYFFLVKKMGTRLGIGLLLVIGVFIALISAEMGVTIAGALFILTVGITFVLFCFIRLKLAYFVSLAIPFAFFVAERKFGVDLPLGVLIQVLIFLTLIFIVAKKLVNRDLSFSFLNYDVMYAMLAIYLFNILQILNPNMISVNGWLIIFKGNLGIIAGFIVVMYLLDMKFLRQFILLWMILAFISALYACYQEWFGLPQFEENWIRSDNLRFRRIFIKGSFRKFSLLSDPAAFGIFMASSSLVAIILSFSKLKPKLRVLSGFAALFMLMAMGYSGTRTAYAMVPAGLVIFGLMTITNRRTLIITILGILSFLFILFGPIHGNATINRFRTTFNADDPSLGVRDQNRAYIQSYVYDNPMGGGLMTTGDAGMKYNPNHALAGFPPDSGYLQRALEIGWIGLAIFMVFLFIGLKNGIKNYYRCNNIELKYYYLAFMVFTFSITIAIYAQLATTQVPISYIFYPVMGMMARMKSIDT
jgi:putative inorganic carbon (HCO3(-)) transporter